MGPHALDHVFADAEGKAAVLKEEEDHLPRIVEGLDIAGDGSKGVEEVQECEHPHFDAVSIQDGFMKADFEGLVGVVGVDVEAAIAGTCGGERANAPAEGVGLPGRADQAEEDGLQVTPPV